MPHASTLGAINGTINADEPALGAINGTINADDPTATSQTLSQAHDWDRRSIAADRQPPADDLSPQSGLDKVSIMIYYWLKYHKFNHF